MMAVIAMMPLMALAVMPIKIPTPTPTKNYFSF